MLCDGWNGPGDMTTRGRYDGDYSCEQPRVSCEGEEAYEVPSQHHHRYHALMASRDNLVSACCTTVCPEEVS